jgi:AcrR family transcriptional regulator
MSSIADKPSSRRRAHDAPASRRALLDAAGSLFDERGYESATVREIGERAGVDPALIARYFGGKEGLYLAALQSQETRVHMPADPVEALEHMLDRADAKGTGPIGLAMVSPGLTAAMLEQVREIVSRNAVQPLAGELSAKGAPDAVLRAELLVAIATGLALTRAGGTLPALADAPVDEIVSIMTPLVEALRA